MDHHNGRPSHKRHDVFAPRVQSAVTYSGHPNVFSKPNQTNYVMFDPPHMIKLARNLLQAYGNINSPSGSISWQYIATLQLIQDDAGLRMGNKLTNKHIRFHLQKMKVSLAAQTLSCSVATAMEALHNADHPEFVGCMETVKFIKVRQNLKKT